MSIVATRYAFYQNGSWQLLLCRFTSEGVTDTSQLRIKQCEMLRRLFTAGLLNAAKRRPFRTNEWRCESRSDGAVAAVLRNQLHVAVDAASALAIEDFALIALVGRFSRFKLREQSWPPRIDCHGIHDILRRAGRSLSAKLLH